MAYSSTLGAYGLGQEPDPYGPDGASANWFPIASSHWRSWSEQYGWCEDFMGDVDAVNRSVARNHPSLSPLTVGAPIPDNWWNSDGFRLFQMIGGGSVSSFDLCDQKAAASSEPSNVVTGELAQQLLAFDGDPIFHDPPPGSYGQCFDVQTASGVREICVPTHDELTALRAEYTAAGGTGVSADAGSAAVATPTEGGGANGGDYSPPPSDAAAIEQLLQEVGGATEGGASGASGAGGPGITYAAIPPQTAAAAQAAGSGLDVPAWVMWAGLGVLALWMIADRAVR